MTHKLGSLFDESGGFPLAGSLCGFAPVWAAEVEPYPIAVTRSRFPSMRHLGDISKVNGTEIEPVDVITFGSPCQDMSVAGKRAGLKHEGNGDDETTRSGLFMEAVRIIREMREATNGVYPRFAFWENVPGAFSSNKGEDFRLVLQELIRIAEPAAIMPAVPKRGWAYADSYCGDGWSLAYRVFNAQYWGVPQRRRRIHLVIDFAGRSAGAVLFERQGVRGYFSKGGTPRQTAAAAPERGACAADTAGAIPYTLKIRSGCEGGGKGALVQENLSATLAVSDDQYLFQPAVYRKGTRPHSKEESQKWEPAEVANTLNTFDYGESRTNEIIIEGCIPINDKATRFHGGGPTRKNDGAGNGLGVGNPGDPAQTLSTCDRHIVAYGIDEGKPGIQYRVRRLTPTECARLQGFADRWGDIAQKDSFTPEEYAFWANVRNTHAAINGKAVKDYTAAQMLTWYNKLHTDRAERKMWGNGIALPPALYCMQGIADALGGATNAEN